MEQIDNLLNIYEQLRDCTNPDEVEKLRRSLKGSNIHLKEVEKESVPDSYKNGGSKDLEVPNIGKSRKLSVVDMGRKVDNLLKEGKELAEKGKFGDDLTIEVEMQVKFPTSDLVGEKFETYMNQISHLLTSNNVSRIGLWGMGGVGKTTLAKHFHNMMLDQRDIYGPIYWITVSKDCNIHKLQTDIAKRIGESISDKLDESQRASILAEAWKRKKKFVLILDDMWSDFDSNEIGMGSPKQVGYRLIVTSRLKDVCLKMYCDPIMKVKPLSPEDAWTLFARSIGREIPDHLTHISSLVLQECAGLPLGIITLAKSMIGCAAAREWSNVLDELRNSCGEVDDMDEKVFKVLRLSFERLKHGLSKNCLLYCATYPKTRRIEKNELIWLFIDARLLGNNVGMAKMFHKGISVLNKLERAALLSFENDEFVVLHDLIRDMALQISKSKFMVEAGRQLKGIPGEESWTDELEVVSLVENQIEEISSLSPKCARLSTLLLQRNRSLEAVSDAFFIHLKGLKHLDLSWTTIITLPKSISSLENLTALILRDCKNLRNLPSLEKLTSLERLDLFRANIRQLPKGMECLIKLRYLNVFCAVESTGPGVISKLTALEYLAITAAVDVEELKPLKNLEHLTILIKDFDSFSVFIKQMKMKGRPNSYNFVFGRQSVWKRVDVSNCLSEKEIRIINTPSPTRNGMGCSDDNRDLVCFGDDETTETRNRLSSWCWSFRLWRRTEIEIKANLFWEDKVQKVLQDIQKLDIDIDDHLMSLEDFAFDTVPKLLRHPKPFFNLKILNLYKCSNMKKLSSSRLLTNLQNIVEIRILSCEGMEALVEDACDETKVRRTGQPRSFCLPKLKYIHLEGLPNLHNLCGKDKAFHTPSIRWIRILSCPKLKRMPFDVDNQHQPKMLYLKDEKEWLQSLEWDPPESKSKITFSPSNTFYYSSVSSW